MTDQAEMQSPEERLAALLEADDPQEIEEERAEEDAEEEVETEEEESQDEPETPVTLKLKRGDEEVEVDLEEAKNLAQMGYDYTKKTQEVAEERKQLESTAQALKAQELAIRQTAELQNALIREFAKVESFNEQISQYESLDWNALSDQDPVQAQKLWIQFQTLQNKRTQAQQDINQKAQGLSQQRMLSEQQRLEQARGELLKAFPNWSAEYAGELRDTVKNYGFSDEEVSGISDPRMVKVIADAMQFRKLQAQKVNVTNKVTGKPAVVKPGAKDTNAATKSKNSELRQTLKKSGRHEDAAKLIERML